MSDLDRAIIAARAAAERAYAPYSRFHVGAAVKLEGIEEPVAGCNVENASFGATVCAERTAILSGVARHGKRRVEFIVVATSIDPPALPCALCLQVMTEFCTPETPIIAVGSGERRIETQLGELLPSPFVFPESG